MDNRPSGRKKNVTGQGKDVYKRGEGLGSGPVGTGGAGPKPPVSGGSGRVPSSGQNVTRSSGGLLKIIIIAAVLLLGGGGGLFGLLGGGSGSGSGSVTSIAAPPIFPS